MSTIAMATVPGADDMDDATVFKHINARHLPDLGLTKEMHYDESLSETVINVHRAFHRRCHDIAVPGQYDHEHVGDN